MREKLSFGVTTLTMMRVDMDEALQRLFNQMQSENNREGKLNISLSVMLEDTTDIDRDTGEERKAKSPQFSYKISYSTKHSTSFGGLCGSTEQILDHDGTSWTIAKAGSEQTSFFDSEDD